MSEELTYNQQQYLRRKEYHRQRYLEKKEQIRIRQSVYDKTSPVRKAYMREYDKQWVENNRERKYVHTKKWRDQHPDQAAAGYSDYYKSNTDERKQRSLENLRKRKYGITPLEYDRLYQMQQGRCKICNKHQTDLGQALHVDHDHVSNKVRGLLCGRCNILLGHAYDSIDILSAAIIYLEASYVG